MPHWPSQEADQGGGKLEASGGAPVEPWPFLDLRGRAVKTPKTGMRGLRHVGPIRCSGMSRRAFACLQPNGSLAQGW